MSSFYITGSTAQKNGSVVAGLGTTSRSDVTDIKPAHSHLKDDGNKAVGTPDATTIRQTTTTALTGITGVLSNVTLQFASAPTLGAVYNVTKASYPFNGTYRVIQVSGNYGITSTPYNSCTGIGTFGVFSQATGTMDYSDNQGDFIIMTNTDEIAGQTNESLKTNLSNDKETLHDFRGYRSHVYAVNWNTFLGNIDKCDITSTDVTFSADHGLNDNPTVVMSIGTKVQSADLTNPDNTGLRDPA